MNIIKTGFLLAGLAALLVGIGNLLGGTSGMVIALTLAALINLGAYWYSDKMAIAVARAQPIDRSQAPQLFDMVARLSDRAGIPMPKLYVAPNPQPNAFATGRNPANAAVVINEGLLQMLDQREVEGVIAHELAHVRNRDTLITTVAATIAGAVSNITQLAFFFGGGRDERPSPLVLMFVWLLGPIAALIIQCAVSRQREFEADRVGASIAGSPIGLANALQRLETGVQAVPVPTSPSFAPLYIINPLRAGGLNTLFSTHPPTAERVRRLLNLQ